MDAKTEKTRRPDKKVVVLGDVDVGKSALIRRYKEGIFIPNTPHTLGVCCTTQEWNDSVIALWDTTGQETLSSLVPLYLKKANAAILCYSMANRESFDSIEKRHSRLLENNVAENCIIVLVGTKSDLVRQETERIVSHEEIVNKASEYSKKWQSLPHPLGIPPCFETSSKDNENVSSVFEYIFDILAPRKDSGVSSQAASYRDLSHSSKASSHHHIANHSTETQNVLEKENDDEPCRCCRCQIN